MAKETRSVFPEGTETSLSALLHRPKCDWPACYIGVGRQAGVKRCLTSGQSTMAQLPAPGSGCPVRGRMNQGGFAHVYLGTSTPMPPARVSSRLVPQPAWPWPLLTVPSSSSCPGQPGVLRGWGPHEAPLGGTPWTSGAQAHCRPPPTPGLRRKHQAVSGPSRGLRSVELSQHHHCQDSLRGGGGGGDIVLACSCPSSSSLAGPLPFLGKVGAPACLTERLTLTCHKGRKENH